LRKIGRIHIVLFLLTCLSTLVAGAVQKGINPFDEPGRIWEGLPFAFSLMLILLCHELAHYFTSRAHKTEATLPYFIPAPPPIIFGTFGAFIKMKSPIISRRALVDIGASGPIAGFVVSVAASAVGLMYSEVLVVEGGMGAVSLGDSLLFSFIARLVLGVPPEGHDILLHPVAFAGWIGLFVTSLNLIPIGQLDGGHVAYALLGDAHRRLSMALVALLAGLGLMFWPGWAIWAALMLVLGLRHPPVVYWEPELDPRRRFIGWLALLIFVVTFIPVPITISL
jgi:membrane-associated protease RseP (regulator of RpoE activity)